MGSMAEKGGKLFDDLACANCHKPDGSGRCPSWSASIGKHVQLADGRVITADEAYIRESILQPDAKVVAGFQPLMPTFQGLVTEEGVVQLVEYIKSLSPAPGTGAAPVNVPPRRVNSSSFPRAWRSRRHPPYRRNVRDIMITAAVQATRELLKRELRPQVVAPHQGPQAHRPAVPRHHHAVLLPRRRLRHADPHRTADAAGRPGVVRDLQQAVHHARRDHGVLLPDPIDSGDAGQFLPADDDRRARSGVSPRSTC